MAKWMSLKELRLEVKRLEAEYERAVEELRLAEAKAMRRRYHPVGTRLVKKENGRVVQRGIVELYRDGDPLPERIGHWNMPQVGDLVIRHADKEWHMLKKLVVVGGINDFGWEVLSVKG